VPNTLESKASSLTAVNALSATAAASFDTIIGRSPRGEDELEVVAIAFY
jgi:hypothetical protein